VLQVGGDDLEEGWQELDAEEELRLSVEAPVEELNQRQEAVGLEHVIPVLSRNTEFQEDFKY